MKFTYKLIVFCLLAIMIIGCSKEATDTYERFYFRTDDGADLAIQVDGNRNSDVFILLLHGGPGGSGYEYNTGEYTENLEEKYAMVYLDQRGQGASQGSYNVEDVTLKQFGDDVYDVTLLLKQKYGQDISVFVMGHSWGGTTGTAAMLETAIQNEIKGWIEVDGAHDIPLINKEAAKLFIQIGNEEITAGRNTEKWQEIVDFAIGLDTNNITEEQGGQINSYGFEAEDLLDQIPSGEGSGSDFNLATAPIFSLSAYLSGLMTANEITPETEQYAMTNRLNEIRIPTLLLWGKYDFVVPPALGRTAFDNIATTDKKLVIFDFSGHSPMDSEPGKFVVEVVDFVETYK
jgi:pimeloyl-ACP methyl ester carboxylesterase